MKKILVLALVLTGCAGGGANDETRVTDWHQQLKIVDPSGNSLSAAAVNVGPIYLEASIAGLTVGGTSMQASDVFMKDMNGYISYSTRDSATQVIKSGAIERVTAYACDNPFTIDRVEYCMKLGGVLSIPQADIFSSTVEGGNLYAVGSTLDESSSPNFGRLYRIPLDASGNPTSIGKTVVLPSYAGTSVKVAGQRLFATSGTSLDPSRVGGLSIFNLADLSAIKFQSLYDARSVSVHSGQAFVVTGKRDAGTPAGVVEYNADGSGSALRTISVGGNTIAESKSSVQVGNQLLLTSLGDQGFKVSCKATGATLAAIPAVTVPGLTTGNTVTNSVAAVPGYIFAANGEAGVYVYTFKKAVPLSGNYCDGVIVTLLGRLSLNDSTYVPGELSANAVYYVPSYNLLNILVSKMVMIAAGNGGVTLLNVTNLNLFSTDVDDF